MADKYNAFGTKLTRDGHEVASLNNIGGVTIDWDEEDVTTHDNAERVEQIALTLQRLGTIPISGFLAPDDTDGQIALMADHAAGTLKPLEIELPNGIAAWSFKAYIKTIATGDATTTGSIPFSATLRLTDERPTLALTMSGGLTDLTGVDSIAGALTFVPVFANNVYQYSVSVATAITYVKLTPTAAAHTITVNGTAVSTGEQSGEIALGAADSTTEIVIKANEANKVARTYKILVARAA